MSLRSLGPAGLPFVWYCELTLKHSNDFTMARRTLEQRNIRSITKLGSRSYAVTIPIEYIREMGWREKQKVNVVMKGNKIIITDWKED